MAPIMAVCLGVPMRRVSAVAATTRGVSGRRSMERRGPAALPLARRERSCPDGVGDKHAEQVEVGGLFVLEYPDFVPGPGERVEDLEAFLGPDQAHGPVDVLADRVGAGWYRCLGRQLGEDPLCRQPASCRAPSAGRRLLR